MTLSVLSDNKDKKIYACDESLHDATLKDTLVMIPSRSKEENALMILKASLSQAKAIVYDCDNRDLEEKIKAIDTHLLDALDFSALFFTSGTTGAPTGAFKNKEEIDAEMNALTQIFEPFKTTKMVVSVPFVHIYGYLVGLLLPYTLGIDVVIREHFLPHDLLAEAKPHCLVVTTPLYIKALLRLDETRDLRDTVFVSSTGPLLPSLAKAFIKKFNTTLFQIFGSTETGTIAYKKQEDILWTPFDHVHVGLNEEGLLHVSSPFVSKTLWNGTLVQTDGKIQTFDYARIEEGKFQLIGRSQTILKIAGKRYSTVQLEEIIEAMEGVQKALVHVKQSDESLKDEIVVVYIESTKVVGIKEIKNTIKKAFGKVNFPIELNTVDTISMSLVGKKIMPVK